MIVARLKRGGTVILGWLQGFGGFWYRFIIGDEDAVLSRTCARDTQQLRRPSLVGQQQRFVTALGFEEMVSVPLEMRVQDAPDFRIGFDQKDGSRRADVFDPGARCLDRCAGSADKVRKCTALDCPTRPRAWTGGRNGRKSSRVRPASRAPRRARGAPG